jgi:hypothetical protein
VSEAAGTRFGNPCRGSGLIGRDRQLVTQTTMLPLTRILPSSKENKENYVVE